MIKQKTRKLFYGKYPYKISLLIPEGCQILILNNNRINFYRTGLRNDNDLTALISNFPELPKQDFKTRKEHRILGLFFGNRDDYLNFLTNLNYWIIETSEPETESELDFLKENGVKKTICKNYPHGKYQFKIRISRHMKYDAKVNFLEWTKKTYQKDQINFPDSTREWLRDSFGWYYTDPYFYVEDYKVLTMIMLYLGSNWKKTEEYVLEESINN